MRTKKVGSTGRFGVRYGLKIRRQVLAVEKIMRSTHICPSCLKAGLKREAAGVWSCKKCGKKIAGGAFAPSTAVTKLIAIEAEKEKSAAEEIKTEKAEAISKE